MSDKPIIFSAPMILALRASRKSQTRRVLNPQPFPAGYHAGQVTLDHVGADRADPDGPLFARFSAPAVGGGAVVENVIRLPYTVGDRLWVREAVRGVEHEMYGYAVEYRADNTFLSLPEADDLSSDAHGDWFNVHAYRSNDPSLDGGKWVPSIHMPRWASRLTLTVTEVRVERLQAISEADAMAEGVCVFVESTDRIAWGDMSADDRNAMVRAVYGSASNAYCHLWMRLHGSGAWDANPWVVAIGFSTEQRNIDA